MNHPEEGLVSIVVPAYNAERFIAETLRGVLAQSYPSIEVIVVNDGSTDSTPTIVGDIYDARLTLVGTANRGVSAARNAGLQRARGAFVAFLDADDLWYPNKLERQIAVLAADPTLTAVGCFMHYVSASGKRLGMAGQALSPEDAPKIASGALMPFPLSSTVFRASAVRQVNGFDEDFNAATKGQGEDLEFLSRIAGLGRVGCIAEPLGAYRIHPASTSVGQFHQQRKAARFVRERRRAEEHGASISWAEFVAAYRLSPKQRLGDMAMAFYRQAGLHAAERRFFRATGLALAALLLSPRYTVGRLLAQRRTIKP